MAIAGPADAQVGRVIVVNASKNADKGAAAAATMRAKLSSNAVLSTRLLPEGDLSRAMEGPGLAVAPADAARARARTLIATASSALANFQPRKSRRSLDAAETLLLSHSTTAADAALLSELAFQSGLLHLYEQNRGLAVTAFALANTTAPTRPPPDRAQYPPEVIKAFKEGRARSRQKATAQVSVSATFDGVPVIIDGKRAGVTPLSVTLSPGVHYITADAPSNLSRGQRVFADTDERAEIRLELAPLPTTRQARALRRALAQAKLTAPDTTIPAPDSASAIAAKLCSLAGADAMFIVRTTDAGATVSLYEHRTQRTMLPRPLDDQVDNLFGLLVPVGRPDLIVAPPEPPPRPTPYWQSWRFRGIVGGAAIVLAGSLVIALSNEELRDRQATFGF